jgi:glycosyltransferase 2 family protein
MTESDPPFEVVDAAAAVEAAKAAGAVEPVEIVDIRPARIRRPLDLIRLSGLVIVLAVLAGFGALASSTTSGANVDLTRLLDHIPRTLVHGLSRTGAFAVLLVPAAYLLSEVIRGQARRLVEGLLTGVVAIAVARGLDALLDINKRTSLYRALSVVGAGHLVAPLDAYLAAIAALLTVIGVSASRFWGRLLITVTVLYMLTSFAAAQASLLSLLVSVVLGMVVGIAVRYLAGEVNERPDGRRIATELDHRGLEVIRLVRLDHDDDEHREYHAWTRDSTQLLIHVLDRDLIAYGWFYSIYRVIRLRAELARPPLLSLERLAERRSLLAYAMMAAQAPIPRLVAGIPVGADAIVLAYEYVDGIPIDQLPDGVEHHQLVELWKSVQILHVRRINHRGLTASTIMLATDGQLILPIPQLGSAFASDLRLSLDRTQLLVATALLVGAANAVRAAAVVLSPDELSSTLPILQPIALNRETRSRLRHAPDLLEELRDQITGTTHQPSLELSRVERVRPRTVLTIVAVIVAAYLLIGQLGSVDLATVFSSARWRWVPLVALASAATYIGAALALTGFVRERLSFARTVLAQLAASFAAFVTPPAVGGLAVNIRYLRKAHLSAAAATTSVAVWQVVNSISYVVLLIVFAAATGASAQHNVPIPSWAFIVIGGLVVALLLALTIPAVRHWLLAKLVPPLREAVPRLLDLVTSPVKLAEALAGALLLNAAYISALWCSVRAFDYQPSFVSVAVVYFAGAAIGSAAPTPGGLGAVEVALSTGLAAIGMPSAPAISAVLLYRIATFWLPVPVGWAAAQYLQSRNAL